MEAEMGLNERQMKQLEDAVRPSELSVELCGLVIGHFNAWFDKDQGCWAGTGTYVTGCYHATTLTKLIYVLAYVRLGLR